MSEKWTVPSTDGVEVAVHELGGSGDPLLICHATGFCGQMYEILATELTARYRVLALDFRGHGESTAPIGDQFAWISMVNDLFAVTDALGSSPIHVFGHSMGGGISLLAEHLRPGTFSQAFLFEPVVIPPGFTDGPNFMAQGARSRRPRFDSRAEVMWRYAQRRPLNELRSDALAAYVTHGFVEEADGSVRLRCLPEHEAAVFECAEATGPAQLATVRIPVMVAAGMKEEAHGPGEWTEMIAEALPVGQARRFEHLRHFGPFQDPVTIGRAILEFFAATER